LKQGCQPYTIRHKSINFPNAQTGIFSFPSIVLNNNLYKKLETESDLKFSCLPFVCQNVSTRISLEQQPWN
jgi:hypothetical protein